MNRKDTFLVFGKPHFNQDEIDEIIDTIKSGWWGTGPKTEKFEWLFKEYIGSKYSLAVNSATSGLFLALKVLGISEGDEVITTPLTFCSTANVILHLGAKPVFADIESDSWNIDPIQIEKKITKKTKAILPVHLHGRPCKMDQIRAIAKKHKLYVVEDAAHATEAWFKKKKIGNISDITVFSFYVTKNIATGEGGMVTTNNRKWIEKMRVLSLHGLSRDAYKRYSVKEYVNYECMYPGYKFNMTDLTASLGIHQLSRVKKNFKIRGQLWDLYNKEFEDCPLLSVPKNEDNDTVHARHIYAILLKLELIKVSRDKCISLLIREKIGSGVHFTPVHLHHYYKKTFGYRKGDYPNAEFIGERVISLPFGANLKVKDIKRVAETVKKLLHQNSIQ
ncbi:DegT/DnrJ/EryC1/StrS family aminotransferase [Candidatus Daviesbacteria bacterium]|nr:DegT/DnrJ/EryC1/StrS family aminotransferase [Candidatus Daviesbacteria bacterium]